MNVITSDLIRLLKSHFALDWGGVHGAPHWARVKDNGLRLAEVTGANTRVVELFAFFHDSCRLNEYTDPDHGRRGAAFARSLAGSVFHVSEAELELVVTACEGHSNGYMEGDPTVLTCWDADRLDLGRVGIKPDLHRLCTAAARDATLLKWAYERSIRHQVA